MKSINMSDILCIIVFILIIGIQGYYLMNYYSADQTTISSNTDEINSRTTRITQLEERLKMLPETEKELELVTSQQEAMLNTIPTANSAVKQMVTLKRFADVNNFYDAKIVEAGSTESQDEIATVIKKDYTVSFTSTYNEARKFIESINTAYQIANINSVNISNDIQTTQDAKVVKALHQRFGNDLSQVVTTQLSFSVYVRKDEETGEVYQPGYNMVTGSETPFANKAKDQKSKDAGEAVTKTAAPAVQEDTPAATPAVESADYSGSVFELYVEDVLTSGDTYKLVGPGESKPYLGLVSQSNTYITITINDDGYELSIEDENGNVKQTSYSMDMKKPLIYIESSMRQIQTVMPNVHVYVYNYASDEAQVKLNGSMTKNIHVYDKFDEELSAGQTKGNVKLA